jgi:hypothetical protein
MLPKDSMKAVMSMGLSGFPRLIGVVAAVALASVPAWPCTWEDCLDTRFYPEEIQAMPANAPGPALLPIRVGPLPDLEERLGGMSFQWLDEGGNPVPHHLVVDQGVIVMKPDEALEANRVYTVDYPNECRGLVQRRTFLASDNAEWPSVVPPVSATPSVVEPVVVLDHSGACTQTLGAAVSRIAVDWTPGFSAWAAVLRVRTIVDDAVWTVSEPGLLRHGHDDLPVYPRGDHGDRRADVLYAVCEVFFGAIDVGLEPGTHRVRVEFLLPGHGAVVAAPEFDITLTCPTDVGEPPDGGHGDHGDAGEEAAPCACSDATPCTGGAGGCVATAHPGRTGGLGALWLLVFLVLPGVVARRRRILRAARAGFGRRHFAGEGIR